VFITIFSVITLLITLVFGVSALAARHHDADPRDVRGLWTATIGSLTVTGVALAFGCITIVGAAETGVPVTFGHIGAPLNSGAHLKLPWTKIHGLPKRPLAVDDITVTARTAQAGQVKVVVGARWHVDPDHATDTYLQVRTGDEGRISREIVSRAIGQATGEAYTQYDNVAASKGRERAQKDVKDRVSKALTRYGIVMDDLFLRSVEPDKTTSDALARLASQQQETAIAREAQATAQEDAKRRRVEAEGLRSAAAGIPAGVSPGQVQLLCAQSWERMATRAIAAGVPLYTAPCGGSPGIVPQAK
jgi:regulator of protease activity HflC (stomatin/prohibitin superfamily)